MGLSELPSSLITRPSCTVAITAQLQMQAWHEVYTFFVSDWVSSAFASLNLEPVSNEMAAKAPVAAAAFTKLRLDKLSVLIHVPLSRLRRPRMLGMLSGGLARWGVWKADGADGIACVDGFLRFRG